MSKNAPDVPVPVTEVGQEDVVARLKLLSDLYDEVRKIAGVLLSLNRGALTLQPTALANEAIAKILESLPLWQPTNSDNCLSLIAVVMRNLLIDHHRIRQTMKRGGGLKRLVFHNDLVASDGLPEVETLDIHQALLRLNEEDARASAVTALRMLGHTTEEIADELNISVSTAESDWRFARAWLRRELASYVINDEPYGDALP